MKGVRPLKCANSFFKNQDTSSSSLGDAGCATGCPLLPTGVLQPGGDRPQGATGPPARSVKRLAVSSELLGTRRSALKQLTTLESSQRLPLGAGGFVWIGTKNRSGGRGHSPFPVEVPDCRSGPDGREAEAGGGDRMPALDSPAPGACTCSRPSPSGPGHIRDVAGS